MRCSSTRVTWALVLAPLLSVGCFDLDEPVCAFRCGPSAPQCPDHYTCRNDGFCHRNGTTAACPFPDAATPADQSIPVLDSSTLDQTVGSSDGGVVDGAANDLTSASDLAAAPDLATAPDLAAAPDLLSPDLSAMDL